MERGRFLTPGGICDLGLEAAVGDGSEKLGKGESVVLLQERDSRAFLRSFFHALSQKHPICLTSPDWGSGRMEELREILATAESSLPEGSILIPTGGTSGRLRLAVHSWETLCNAAEAFARFHGLTERGVHSLCVLPMWHVSGLMQAVRVAVCGGRLVHGNAHDPMSELPVDFSPKGFFLSLVPTQLRRLMDGGAEGWLRRFEAVHIGGAALDDNLRRRAFEARLPLSPSYGMTETAAMICALSPEEFLAGKDGSGRHFDHVSIEVEPPMAVGEADPSCRKGGDRQDAGRIRVRATSLCHAVIPGVVVDSGAGLLTGDRGWVDAEGILHVTGRVDRVIVSGGQKIEPAEVEAVLLESGLVRDVYVTGVPDPEWGNAVIAFYVPVPNRPAEVPALRAIVTARLSPVHVPKRWISLAAIPRTAAGKPDVAAMKSCAATL